MSYLLPNHLQQISLQVGRLDSFERRYVCRMTAVTQLVKDVFCSMLKIVWSMLLSKCFKALKLCLF